MARTEKRLLLVAVALVLSASAARTSPQAGSPVDPAVLNATQIADGIERHDRMRMRQLEHYHSTRLYAVEYRGFSRTISATMEVDSNYDAASGKSLRILSESGSHLLCEKVLKRAVDSEIEAWRERSANALTRANYRFQLLGSESLDGRPAYILAVEPIKPSKFLYRGKIWVDTTDFAVAKIEAEPSKNPSFWLSRSLIEATNQRAGGFWLPKFNRSESKIRIGGVAVLTIDYGTYRIVPTELRAQNQALDLHR